MLLSSNALIKNFNNNYYDSNMFKSEDLQKRQNLTFFIKFNLSLFNLIIIIINLFLILKNKATKDKEKIRDKDIKINLKFKNAEEFLYLISKKYKQISNYLNEKYNHKIINNMAKSNKRYKKRISLYSVDLFNPKGHRFWLKNKLKDKFRIKFDKNKPDYLIYNVFGNEHLNEKYSNSIKLLTVNIYFIK